MKRIEILHEDDNCLVLNKPAGLAVQGGEGVTSSLDKILAENWKPSPLLVHRLDKDTSGIILTAKSREAAFRFSRLFGFSDPAGKSAPVSGGKRTVTKQYIAVCFGKPAQAAGSITLDIEIRASVKKAETRYRLLKTGSVDGCTFSVLELELGSGRMHQIRRHLAMTGNPILGDDKYGDFSLNRKLRKSAGLKRLLLHASRLIIPRQEDGFELDICAPLPPCFEKFTDEKELVE
jgi:23S rRNA pseudouridine955/2504/2580 synthase